MSSGSHLSKELLDLVKSIGESRSKQEEDKIITAEAQILKLKFLERNLTENVDFDYYDADMQVFSCTNNVPVTNYFVLEDDKRLEKEIRTNTEFVYNRLLKIRNKRINLRLGF